MDHRAWLAKQLNVADVPTALWDYMVEESYVTTAIEEGVEGRHQLLEAARRFQRAVANYERAEQVRQTSRSSPMREARSDQSFMARARVLSDYFGRRATSLPRVRRYRRDVLGDRTLSEEEAWSFIRSEATSRLSRGEFVAWGVPIVGHEVTVSSKELVVDHGVITDPHDQQEVFIGLPPLYCERVVLHDGNSGAGWTAERQFTRDAKLDQLPFPSEDFAEIARVLVWPRSVLHELYVLSTNLAEMFGWQHAQATWFLLTGRIPFRSPIRVNKGFQWDHESGSRVTITVTAEARLPPG